MFGKVGFQFDYSQSFNLYFTVQNKMLTKKETWVLILDILTHFTHIVTLPLVHTRIARSTKERKPLVSYLHSEGPTDTRIPLKVSARKPYLISGQMKLSYIKRIIRFKKILDLNLNHQLINLIGRYEHVLLQWIKEGGKLQQFEFA